LVNGDRKEHMLAGAKNLSPILTCANISYRYILHKKELSKGKFSRHKNLKIFDLMHKSIHA